MNKLILTVALTLIGATAFVTSASAQAVAFGDLALNFRLANNTASNDLEVDLGNFNFSQSQASVAGFAAGAADLSAAFTSSWASNGSNLVFSLAETDDVSTLYIGNPGNAATINKINDPASGGNMGQVANLYEEFNGTPTGTADTATVISPAGDPNSYTDVLLNVNKDYGSQPFSSDYGFATYNMEQSYSSLGSSITIYKQTSGTSASSTVLGTFTLEGNGTLAYQAGVGAAPEPSTYALMALGGLMLLFVRRRAMRA